MGCSAIHVQCSKLHNGRRLPIDMALVHLVPLLGFLSTFVLEVYVAYASPTRADIFLGAQTINLWRLENQDRLQFTSQNRPQIVLQSPHKYEEFPEQWFEQPLDHFSNDSFTFKQRYWVNKRHYKKGGPVIVLDGGETSGEDRIPFLDTGIVEILTKATNGFGVVLEHRYYGKQYSASILIFTCMTILNRGIYTSSKLLNGLAKVYLLLIARSYNSIILQMARQ